MMFEDRVPKELQVQMGEMAGCEIAHVDAGHMAMISKPEVVAETIKKAAMGD